jgi:hypothetical protein
MEELMKSLNTNMFFIGIMMLVLNVGSRYIVHEFSDDDEEYKQNIILRRVAIFAACFVGTRDLFVSLVLTAVFVIISTGMYHTKSIYAREGMSNEELLLRGTAVAVAGFD